MKKIEKYFLSIINWFNNWGEDKTSPKVIKKLPKGFWKQFWQFKLKELSIIGYVILGVFSIYFLSTIAHSIINNDAEHWFIKYSEEIVINTTIDILLLDDNDIVSTYTKKTINTSIYNDRLNYYTNANITNIFLRGVRNSSYFKLYSDTEVIHLLSILTTTNLSRLVTVDKIKMFKGYDSWDDFFVGQVFIVLFLGCLGLLLLLFIWFLQANVEKTLKHLKKRNKK